MPKAQNYAPNPGPVQQDEKLLEIIQWAQREFEAIGRQFTNFDVVQQNVLHVEPVRPREGLVIVADGSDWDPGSGAGQYTYVNGVWVYSGLDQAQLDGDKGDIIVSAGGAAWTIDNNAVTFAKMQDIATSRLLGRLTASSGDIEELTGTQATTLLDNFTSTLKGLAPLSGGGTANFLRADGTWQPAGGSVLITTVTANNTSTSLVINSGITSTYRAYLFQFNNILPATDAVNFKIQIDEGTGFKTATYLSARLVGNSGAGFGSEADTAGVGITYSTGLASNVTAEGGVSGHFILINPSNTTHYKMIYGEASLISSTGALNRINTGGCYTGNTNAVTAVRILSSSGNLVSGSMTMYGLL